MTQSFSGMGSTVTVDKLTEFVRHAAQELQAFDQLCNPPTGAALGRNRGDTVNYTFYQTSPRLVARSLKIARCQRGPWFP